MPRPDFFAFLEASLACLAAEEPQAHRALAEAVGPLRVRLDTTDAVRTLAYGSGGWRFADGEAGPTIRFDHHVILDLVDGELALDDAIEAERLQISGPVDALERLHAALLIYIEGMLRAPGAVSLLERYRAGDLS